MLPKACNISTIQLNKHCEYKISHYFAWINIPKTNSTSRSGSTKFAESGTYQVKLVKYRFQIFQWFPPQRRFVENDRPIWFLPQEWTILHISINYNTHSLSICQSKYFFKHETRHYFRFFVFLFPCGKKKRVNFPRTSVDAKKMLMLFPLTSEFIH